jgi:glyoxylase-like metal-dependent hydrolase (beta-lactamase superfamily II)
MSAAPSEKPAVRRTTLGDFELTILSDGQYYLDGGSFFGVVPKVLWEKKIQPDARNRITGGLNSLLIRTGKHTVLVETGIGNKLSERMQRIYEPQAQLLKSFETAGVSPDEVDIVINTHLHFDHCGWNTLRTANGNIVPTFPKAKYYVQEGEWRHASVQHIRDRVSYLSENYDPLIQTGQMHLLHGDADIVPGVSVKLFPGHTQHMQAVKVRSGEKKACYISDLIPTTAHLELTWLMAFDLFPLETIESKKRFYERAVPDKWLVVFTHETRTPWAYLEESAEGKVTARAL